MHHQKTTTLMLCALFTALISISAFIRIPTPLVPVTLQSGMVLLSGILLGPKYGSISVLLYVMLGLCGVPVFALGGGFGYVFQPTFGYLIGFVVGAYLTGFLAWKASQRESRLEGKQIYLFALAGLAAIYFIGFVYCYCISTWVLGTVSAFWPLVISCFLIPLPGDVALCVLVSILGKRMLPHTKKYIL